MLLEVTLYNFFFDEDDYLIYHTNDIKEEVLIKAIYEALSKSSGTELHKNTDRYHMEIMREIKYVNLYQLDNAYGCDLHLNSLYQLYSNITYNALKNIKLAQYPDRFLKEKEDELIMLHNNFSIIEEEQSNIIDKDLNEVYKGDIEAYEDNLYGTYGDSFYKADVYGVSIEDIKQLQISKHQEAFKELYIFENHQLEMELIEKYNNNKPLDKKDEINFTSNIPATKMVKGKRKHLTVGDIKKQVKANKKKYIQDLQIEQENNRFIKREEDKEIIEEYNTSYQLESNSRDMNIDDYSSIVNKYEALGFSRDNILAGKHSDEMPEMIETNPHSIMINQKINRARKALLEYRARVENKYNPPSNNNAENIDLDEEEIPF